MKTPKQKMPLYQLITLDAGKMIETGFFSVQKVDNLYVPHYQYDLSKAEFRDKMIREKEDLYSESALIYQICRLLDSANNPGDIRKSLLFVDFSGKTCSDLLKKSDSKTAEEQKNSETGGASSESVSLEDTYLEDGDGEEQKPYGCRTEEELAENSRERLRCLLRPLLHNETSNGFGITITFEDGDTKTFVPFDKSASMSRASLVSYVNCELKIKLDSCLNLDMDFSEIDAIPSKYFAYRGLYLTDAKRICQNERLVLNKDTVLVLPDKELLSEKTSFTSSRSEYVGRTELLLYDGEGVISPAYAEELRKQLSDEDGQRHNAYSFQVRLPFGKGMLHQVDFHRFLAEQFSVDWSAPHMVKDAFGWERDLGKVQIILTQSMLKCKKWLQDWIHIQDEANDADGLTDPMGYYFDKMKEYDHSLYIARTDRNLHNFGEVKLGYQFLSTLALSAEDFDKLVQKQLTAIDSVEDQLIERGESEGNDEENQEDSATGKHTQEDASKWDKCLSALAKNRGFLSDPAVKDIVRSVRSSYERDMGLGRISVSGEQRFFSGDLMGLMVDLAFSLTKTDPESFSQGAAVALYAKCLRPGRFYMPKGKMPLKARQPYVFLRSPHLSRNEQCLLVPYWVPDGLYQQYFSHLTGIVMVSNNSCVPMALGGADFDGDLVKIISEDVIVRSVEISCHEKKGKIYQRKLPVVNIDDAGTGNGGVEKIAVDKKAKAGGVAIKNPEKLLYETAENTFANQIGLLSNLAIRYAAVEYAGRGYQGSCAACAIATGKEIDAAKTGIHPEEEIRRLISGLPKSSAKGKQESEQTDEVQSIKEGLKQLTDGILESPRLLREEKTDGRSVWKLYQSKVVRDNQDEDGLVLRVEDRSWGEAVPVIFRLASRLMRYLNDKEQAKTHNPMEKESEKADVVLFEFQQKSDWKTALKRDNLEYDDLKDGVRQLAKAYSEARAMINSVFRWRENRRRSSWLGHIFRLLETSYDDIHQPLPESGEASVEFAISTALNDFCTFSEQRIKADKPLVDLADARWHICAPQARKDWLESTFGPELLNDASVELLSDFRNSGFYLLFYTLKEAERMVRSEAARKDSVSERIQKADEIRSAKQGKEGRNPLRKNNKYYDSFVKMLIKLDATDLTKSGCLQALNSACREKMEELFGEDMAKALHYVCAVVPKAERSKMMWNVFEKQELLKHIAGGRQEEAAEHHD